MPMAGFRRVRQDQNAAGEAPDVGRRQVPSAADLLEQVPELATRLAYTFPQVVATAELRKKLLLPGRRAVRAAARPDRSGIKKHWVVRCRHTPDEAQTRST